MASTCDPALGSGNVGLAFGLVTAAGLSTTLGAGLAFVMPRSEGGKNLFLAASLGVATGVMLYVSFIGMCTCCRVCSHCVPLSYPPRSDSRIPHLSLQPRLSCHLQSMSVDCPAYCVPVQKYSIVMHADHLHMFLCIPQRAPAHYSDLSK